MPRSNRTHESNSCKTTAAPAPRRPTTTGASADEMDSCSDSQPAQADERQVHLSEFGFILASQLRFDDLNGDEPSAVKAEHEEGGR